MSLSLDLAQEALFVSSVTNPSHSSAARLQPRAGRCRRLELPEPRQRRHQLPHDLVDDLRRRLDLVDRSDDLPRHTDQPNQPDVVLRGRGGPHAAGDAADDPQAGQSVDEAVSVPTNKSLQRHLRL